MNSIKLKLYIANLGKYNEGKLKGSWITLPVSYQELSEFLINIGINEEYEEYAIHDYEANFLNDIIIEEYSDIHKLNEVAKELATFDEEKIIALRAYLRKGKEIKYAIEKVKAGDFRIYYDCYTIEDVAYQIVDDYGLLNDAPELLRTYFDYEAYGRDIEIEGDFVRIAPHYIEII